MQTYTTAILMLIALTQEALTPARVMMGILEMDSLVVVSIVINVNFIPFIINLRYR